MSPRALGMLTALFVGLGLGLGARVASAAPASDQLGAEIPITAPWFEPRITGRNRPAGINGFHEPGVLFINFDGEQMMNCNGTDDSRGNCSSIMNDVVLPYSGGESARAAVVQAMAGDVADFAVDVISERPPDDVEYDMVMVGNWDPPPEEGGFAGVAPTIDCWNTNRSETSFSLDLGSPSVVAKVVGQEAAHVWGLEHVDSPNDLLFPTTGGAADPSFENVCYQIVVLDGGIAPTQANCPDMHEINCPDQPDFQNSYLDMMMVFGPPEPDMVAPTIEILSPTEGEVFPSGTDIDLRISMVDNIAPPLFNVFAAIDVDERGDQLGGGNEVWRGPELTIPINGLPDGEHFIRVDVSDQDENFSIAMVNFAIGDDIAPSDESGDAGDDGDDDGDGDAGTDDGDGDGGTAASDDTGGDGDSGGENADDSGGCGCNHRGAHARWLPVMFLGLLLRRRKRA